MKSLFKHKQGPGASEGLPRRPHRSAKVRILSVVIAAFLSFGILSAQAQWKTESFRLKNGWNGIYLHIDAKYADLTALVDATQISEVWLWTPTFTSRQFITSPDIPTNTGSNWLYWQRSDPGAATLNRLIGNAAYLIKFDGVDDTIWDLRGIPVPPVYKWSSSGENFLGLSTPAGAEPDFESYLAQEPALASSIKIFQYDGGDLADNPKLVLALRTTPVTRGKAFWMKSDTFNSYFHPFDLSLQSASGVNFPGSTAEYTVRIRNRTDNELTVTLQLVDSESPPEQAFLDSGDPGIGPQSLPGIDYDTPIAGLPPVIVRGALIPQQLSFGFSSLNGADHTVTLKPDGERGSEQDVVLGVNLASLGGSAGDFFAGIIRFSDSLGHAAIDVPVRIVKRSKQGLWVGQARVANVKNSTTVSATQTFGATSTPAPLRLIVHHDNSNGTKLLQRIYYGFDTNMDPLVSTGESLLATEYLNISRRISAVHLPWTHTNNPWDFAGTFDESGTLNATVTTAFDDQRSNPFLHTYHPDHDNKDALFGQTQPQGQESYSIVRNITLNFQAATGDFESATRDGSHSLSGDYDEVITIEGKGTESKEYFVKGTFSLTHLIQDMPLNLQIP